MANSTHASAALQASESEFRLLVDAVTDYAIFMLDPSGRIKSWNQGASRIKGYKLDEVIGRHFSIFYPEDDIRAGKCEHELDVATRTGRFEDFGWRVRKDGSRFFANVVITALRDETGVLRGFSKVTRDITERRQAEDRLRESEERFRLLVEGVQEYAIYMLDTGGHVVLWNSGAERIKGYSAAEIVGKHISEFYAPEDRTSGKAERELAHAVAEGRFEEEGWRVRKDGSRFWAYVVLTPLRTRDGKLIGFAKVTRDLTTRRAAEAAQIALATEQVSRRAAEERARERATLVAELEESNRRLLEAVRARDDFLSIASHELKTPIYTLAMVISSGLWLAETKGFSPEKLVERMRKAHVESDRLNRLVSNLLDVSRLAANRLTLEPEDLELRALLREVLDRERDEVVRSGSAVVVHADEAIEGRWDRFRVDQIITNLLSNALKYGAQKPITLTLRRVGDRVRLTVTDEGIGIEPQDQARIFERFERAVAPREYAGLGLWIVKQIVDAMGGEIEVRSSKDQGSTFTVALPLAPADVSAG